MLFKLNNLYIALLSFHLYFRSFFFYSHFFPLALLLNIMYFFCILPFFISLSPLCFLFFFTFLELLFFAYQYKLYHYCYSIPNNFLSLCNHSPHFFSPLDLSISNIETLNFLFLPLILMGGIKPLCGVLKPSRMITVALDRILSALRALLFLFSLKMLSRLFFYCYIIFFSGVTYFSTFFPLFWMFSPLWRFSPNWKTIYGKTPLFYIPGVSERKKSYFFLEFREIFQYFLPPFETMLSHFVRFFL